MSKIIRPIWPVFAASLLILQFFTIVKPQDIEAAIKLDVKTPAAVTVTGRFSEPRKLRNLSFMLDYGGIAGLGERISGVRVQNSAGEIVPVRTMIPGEYLAESEFVSWSYTVDLTPKGPGPAFAHTSWLKGDDGCGVLMLDDILPQTGNRGSAAKIVIDTGGLRIFTTEQSNRNGVYEIRDIEKAVFVVGGDRRDYKLSADGLPIRLSLAGEWPFTETEASEVAQDIFAEYRQMFGGSPTGTPLVSLIKFPLPVSEGVWEGDTRGRTVTILSSDMPFKTQSLQRLHEQLRHEIFHLWVPNGLALSGNYDWFYEGFALYQSLKVGVGVNRIRFDDMLDTLSRAYDIDRFQSQKASLVAASKNRWNGANTQVYARGLLVAFLSDLATLDASKGKRSTDGLLRELYEKFRGTIAIKDGNEAVIELFRTKRELAPIVDRYITGSQPIEWTALLAQAGIEAVTRDQLTKLQVVAKPTGRQKDLLDRLGYNNWRKLTTKH